MVIYIGADHRGFALKESLKAYLSGEGYAVEDLGNAVYDQNDDYPVFAAAVAAQVSRNFETARGIVICGSGVGVDEVANKVKGVRAALVSSPDQSFQARRDDDANVLALAAEFVSEDDAKKITQLFLTTPFEGAERQRRRLEEMSKIENGGGEGGLLKP